MWHTGSALAKANSFSYHFGISSNPYDLWVLTCDNKLYRPTAFRLQQIFTRNISDYWHTDTTKSGSRSIDTCSNALLISSTSTVIERRH